MTVEEARHSYLFAAANAVFTCNASRRYREQRWLDVDAASIALDLANAEASLKRQRGRCGVGLADHVFHVDIFDNPNTATQCRVREGYSYCPVPRDQHPANQLSGGVNATTAVVAERGAETVRNRRTDGRQDVQTVRPSDPRPDIQT